MVPDFNGFSVSADPFSAPCSSLRERIGVDQSEYSWCSPPSTDLARTSAPGVHGGMEQLRSTGFFAVVAMSLAVYGLIIAGAIKFGTWTRQAYKTQHTAWQSTIWRG